MKFRSVSHRTPNQKRFIQAVNEKDIIITDSVFGTGKTYISIGLACEYLIKEKVEKIVLARTTKHLTKEFGFSTGSWAEKSRDMFSQAVSYFKEFLGEPEFEKLWKNGVIEFTSTSILRGRSFVNTFYICEEIQELSRDEWILILSRLDKGSKFVAIGDRDQNGGNEGFFARMFDNLEDEALGKVIMTEEDIQRNKNTYRICKKIKAIR